MKPAINFAKENSNKYGSKQSGNNKSNSNKKGGNGFKNQAAITNLHKYQGK